MSFDRTLLRKIIEGALLAAGEPLSTTRMLLLFPDDELQPEKDELKAVLEDIQADSAERGFELKQVGSGWRFQVVEGVAPWVNRLWDERPQKYSRAMLETLALIAYRQPITRGDIEEIRGVAVSSHIIKTLSEREWIKVVGQRDVPGRPSLYATTRHFLDYFNLKSLDELPTLSEISDLEKLNSELDFEADKNLAEAGVNTGTVVPDAASDDEEALNDEPAVGIEESLVVSDDIEALDADEDSHREDESLEEKGTDDIVSSDDREPFQSEGAPTSLFDELEPEGDSHDGDSNDEDTMGLKEELSEDLSNSEMDKT